MAKAWKCPQQPWYNLYRSKRSWISLPKSFGNQSIPSTILIQSCQHLQVRKWPFQFFLLFASCLSYLFPWKRIEWLEHPWKVTCLSLFFLACDSKRGLTDKAVRLLKRSIELDNNFAEPYSVLASIYGEKGMAQSARILHLKALDLIPNNPDLINNYGAYLQSSGSLKLFQSLKQIVNNLYFQEIRQRQWSSI